MRTSGRDGRWPSLHRRALAVTAIVLFSVVTKLLVLAVAAQAPERLRARDTASYERPALSLLQHGRFSSVTDGIERPETLRTPGYPFFLATVYAVFGRSPIAVAMVQILVSLGTLVLTWWLAFRLFGSAVAYLAAILLAADLLTVGYSLMMLAETLFTFLFCGFALSLLRWHQRPGFSSALLCGALLALATLVRPVSYYLIAPVVVGVGVWARYRGATWRRVLGVAVAVLVPFLLLVGGWQLRNHALTGSSQLSRIEGINLLFFRGAAIVAHRDGVSLEEARRQLGRDSYQQLHPATRDWTPEHLSEQWRREALGLFLAHPWSATVVTLRGLIRVFSGPGDGIVARLLGESVAGGGPLGDLSRLSPAAYWHKWVIGHPLAVGLLGVAVLHMVLVYGGTAFLASAALVDPRSGCREHLPVHVALAITAIALALISAGPEAYYRFRVPLSPLLTVYGAAGLLAIWPFVPRLCSRLRSQAAP